MPQAVYFVRYAHEMNGIWFPWAQEPSAYRASFAAVAGWFRAASCGAMMLWAPNWRACVSVISYTCTKSYYAALRISGTVFSKAPLVGLCFQDQRLRWQGRVIEACICWLHDADAVSVGLLRS